MDDIDLNRAIRRNGFTGLVAVERMDAPDIAGTFILRIGNRCAQGHPDELVACIARSEHGNVNSLLQTLDDDALLPTPLHPDGGTSNS